MLLPAKWMALRKNTYQCCRKESSALGLFSHAKAQVLQIHLIIAVIKVITLPVYSRAQGLLMGTNQDIKACCQLGLKVWGDNEGGLELGFSSTQ